MGDPKVQKGFAISTKFFKGLAGTLQNISRLGFDLFGMFMQLGQSMGILQPIMQMVQGVFGIMGGAAFEAGGLGDALKDLADFLFSDEMILFWEQLGTTIGEFFSYIIGYLIELFKNPWIQKFIINVIGAIIKVMIHMGQVFAVLLAILATMPIGVLGAFIFFIATTSAFLKGLAAAPGIEGVILGTAMASMVGVALAPLLSLGSGGLVPASSA